MKLYKPNKKTGKYNQYNMHGIDLRATYGECPGTYLSCGGGSAYSTCTGDYTKC